MVGGESAIPPSICYRESTAPVMFALPTDGTLAKSATESPRRITAGTLRWVVQTMRVSLPRYCGRRVPSFSKKHATTPGEIPVETHAFSSIGSALEDSCQWLRGKAGFPMSTGLVKKR
jgi:hypothetical protein